MKFWNKAKEREWEQGYRIITHLLLYLYLFNQNIEEYLYNNIFVVPHKPKLSVHYKELQQRWSLYSTPDKKKKD